jgi:hypothetical protein
VAFVGPHGSCSTRTHLLRPPPTDVILGGYLQQLRDEFRRWLLVEAGEDQAWRELAGGRRSFLWLDQDEATAFSKELGAVLDRYTADRDAVNHPAGTRRVLCMVAVVPAGDAAD